MIVIGVIAGLIGGVVAAVVSLSGDGGDQDTELARRGLERLLDGDSPLDECPLGDGEEALFSQLGDQLDNQVTDAIVANDFTRADVGGYVFGVEVLQCTNYGDGKGDPRLVVDVMATPDGGFAAAVERGFDDMGERGAAIDVDISPAGDDRGAQLTHVSVVGDEEHNEASIAAWSDEQLTVTVSVEAPEGIPDPESVEAALLAVLPTVLDSLAD